jgi:predicted transport protein
LKEEVKECSKKLEFLDIMDYSKIILKNWDFFKEIFGSKERVESNFLDLKNFRNSIKHSRSLDREDLLRGKASLIWLDNCMNIQDEIIEESLEEKEEEGITKLFESFKEKVISFGKDVLFVKNKYYSAFKRNSNFVTSKIQRNGIKIYFKLNKKELDDPLNLVRDVSNIGHHGTGNYELVFSNKKDLEYILRIIKRCYELDDKLKAETQFEDHLSKITNPLTEKRVKELITMIHSKFKVEEHYSKMHIKFRKKTDFCLIYCQKDQFWLDLKLDKKEIKNNELHVRDHKDKVWTHIRINNQVNLEDLMQDIELAYKVN